MRHTAGSIYSSNVKFVNDINVPGWLLGSSRPAFSSLPISCFGVVVSMFPLATTVLVSEIEDGRFRVAPHWRSMAVSMFGTGKDIQFPILHVLAAVGTSSAITLVGASRTMCLDGHGTGSGRKGMVVLYMSYL